MDAKIVLAGEIRLIIHAHLLDGNHAVKELQTLKWLITNEDKAADLDDLHKQFTNVSTNFLVQVDWKDYNEGWVTGEPHIVQVICAGLVNFSKPSPQLKCFSRFSLGCISD